MAKAKAKPKAKPKTKPKPLLTTMADWETEDSLMLLRAWKREGMTDEQIAKQKIGVSHQTLLNWKHKSPLIVEALKKSREEYHKELETAMYKRALGYYVDESVTEYVYDEEGNEVIKTKRVTHKYLPPSETMQIFVAKHDIRGEWLNEKTQADEEEQKQRIAKLKKEAEKEDDVSAIKITIEGGDGYAD